MFTRSRLIIATLTLTILSVCCLGLYDMDLKSNVPSKIAHQFPALKFPIELGLGAGEKLDSGLNALKEFAHLSQTPNALYDKYPLLKTGAQASQALLDYGENGAGAISDSLWPNADIRLQQQQAQEQLNGLNQAIAEKQQELNDMQKEAQALEKKANPMQRLIPPALAPGLGLAGGWLGSKLGGGNHQTTSPDQPSSAQGTYLSNNSNTPGNSNSSPGSGNGNTGTVSGGGAPIPGSPGMCSCPCN